MRGFWLLLCGLPFTFFCKGQATFSKLYDYGDTTIWGQSILIADANFYIIGEGYTYDVGLSTFILKTDMDGKTITVK